MSEITKKALAQALKELLSKKELSKITIKNITDYCGVNRQTFYYHFKDVYDLIEWIYTSEVIEIEGEERVNLAKVRNIETEEVTSIECDSLILSVGYLPDNDFIRKMSLMTDGDRVYSENNQTSVEGIFITGTMEKGIKDLFKSGENGFKVGKQVAEYLK